MMVVPCTLDFDNNKLKRFPAHDEVGMCRTSLVSPQQPVLRIPIRPHKTTVLAVIYGIG